MKYIIVRKEDYEWLKNENKSIKYNYDRLLKLTNKEMDDVKESVKELTDIVRLALDKLNLSETSRKTNASKLGGLTTALNKEKNKTKELLNAIDSQKEHYENKVNELEDNVKDLENKLEESMSDKYLVKKIPSGRRPKTQTMKIKNCTVESNIARKMFGDSK